MVAFFPFWIKCMQKCVNSVCELESGVAISVSTVTLFKTAMSQMVYHMVYHMENT